MDAQRRGTDLTIHIRIALASLKRDPHQYDGQRLTIAQRENILRDLRKEQRDVGGILKDGA